MIKIAILALFVIFGLTSGQENAYKQYAILYPGTNTCTGQGGVHRAISLPQILETCVDATDSGLLFQLSDSASSRLKATSVTSCSNRVLGASQDVVFNECIDVSGVSGPESIMVLNRTIVRYAYYTDDACTDRYSHSQNEWTGEDCDPNSVQTGSTGSSVTYIVDSAASSDTNQDGTWSADRYAGASPHTCSVDGSTYRTHSVSLAATDACVQATAYNGADDLYFKMSTVDWYDPDEDACKQLVQIDECDSYEQNCLKGSGGCRCIEGVAKCSNALPDYCDDKAWWNSNGQGWMSSIEAKDIQSQCACNCHKEEIFDENKCDVVRDTAPVDVVVAECPNFCEKQVENGCNLQGMAMSCGSTYSTCDCWKNVMACGKIVDERCTDNVVANAPNTDTIGDAEAKCLSYCAPAFFGYEEDCKMPEATTAPTDAPSGQGSGEQGSGEQGTGEQGTGEQGTGEKPTGEPGTGEGETTSSSFIVSIYVSLMVVLSFYIM